MKKLAKIFLVILVLTGGLYAAINTIYAGFVAYYPQSPSQSAYNTHQYGAADNRWYWPKDLPPVWMEKMGVDYKGDIDLFRNGAMCETACPTCIPVKDVKYETTPQVISK